MVKDIIISMRPQQWLKNLFVFAALIFSHQYNQWEKVGLSLAAFVIFCLLSGSVYLINDIIDAEEDKKHESKKDRPVASGRLSPSLAGWVAVIVALLSLGAAWKVGSVFALVALAYFVLIVAYSLVLKHIVIVDVLVVAGGFVLRAVAGGRAIDVPISVWLYLCTFLLALFLILSKRRHELVLLEENAAQHRKSLAEYTPYLLDQMIAVVTSSTLMAFALYTLHERTIREVSDKLYLTLPFVVYGIFRYLYLVHQKSKGGHPEKVLFTDPALLIDILLWVISVFIILQLK